MSLHRIVFILLFTICFFALATAQQRRGSENDENDDTNSTIKEALSPDSVFVSYFSLNEQGAYQTYSVSKPLNKFQEYDVAKQYNQTYANLGNPGSASYPLLYSLKPTPNFRFRSDVFEPYTLKDDSIKFFISENPFSHIRYHMGTAKEQKLDINFAQRIGSGIYLGLNARFAISPGIYLRQRAHHAGATFYGAFLYPSKRYGALLTVRTDKLKNNENGGIKYLTDFTSNNETDREVITTNLSNAMNRGKNSGVVFQQYFNILKQNVVKRTDSTTTANNTRKFDAGRIVHTMRYTRSGSTYEDLSPSSNFSYYPDYFIDTVAIFDSVLITHFENCFVYSNEVPDTSGNSFPLQYSFGLRLQADRLHRDTTMTDVFRQTVPFGMLKGIIKGKTFFKASAYLVLGGYNGGDYSLNGSFYQFFGKYNNKAYLNVSQGLMHPEYFYNSYYTDYFNWNNSFGAQAFFKGDFGVIYRGFDLRASYSLLTNYVFLNSQILPEQYSKSLRVLSGSVNKEFRYKHWITNIYTALQQVTPDSVLQLPAVIGKLTLCYDVELFKKALHAQVGISGTYHTKWHQDAYMPAIRSFYKQRSYESGNYPYLDVFVNLNIKRARIFVKYEHFNAGLMGYNYILVPDYPQADAAFKFGVSWLFFD